MFQNILNSCQNLFFDGILKNWQHHAFDKELGFSFESMKHDWSQNKVGRVRLLTQCRQLFTLSYTSLSHPSKADEALLTPLFEFITSQYWIENRWIFSLDDDLKPLDTKSDAYALAFVLLSFSFYYRATNDKKALEYITNTHAFLQKHMTSAAGGIEESYPVDPSQTRRQNPHMHLLEGYIAAYKATQEDAYKAQVEKLLDLARSTFFDPQTNTLREFFTADWRLDPRDGHLVEPGHHFEWVWLLHEANKISPNPQNLLLARNLWEVATKYGISPSNGIYNQINADTYLVVDPEKRIWPLTEYLKAITVIDIPLDEKKNRLQQALNFLLSHYLTKDGRWNEYLDEDDLPKDFPLPGTTTYHIFLGLNEVINWSQEQAN